MFKVIKIVQFTIEKVLEINTEVKSDMFKLQYTMRKVLHVKKKRSMCVLIIVSLMNLCLHV